MRRCVSCERGVWTCGACSFMWESMRGVITLCEVVGGRNGVCLVWTRKNTPCTVWAQGCWLGIVMRVRALQGWCGGRWSLRTFRR